MRFYAALIVILALFAGWYAFPYFMVLLSPGCVEESLVVYDEPEQTIIADARWLATQGRQHVSYSATLYRFSDGKLQEKINAERTLNMAFAYAPFYINVQTADAYRISGPETSAVWPGAYIDPVAEKNFSAGVYLFRTGKTFLTGLKDRPRGVCY